MIISASSSQLDQYRTKMARKKGRHSTWITKKTKPNENKSIKVIHTAINSKLMNIVRILKAQGTETTTTQFCYNINVAGAMLY